MLQAIDSKYKSVANESLGSIDSLTLALLFDTSLERLNRATGKAAELLRDNSKLPFQR